MAISEKQEVWEMAQRMIEDRQKASSEIARFTDNLSTGPQYIQENGCLFYISCDARGNIRKKMIANFFPIPLREILRDDGQETDLIFEIEAIMAEGKKLPAVQIHAPNFQTMTWIERVWGLQANIEPGNSSRDRVRHVIQQQAADISRHVVFTHSGWREVDGKWCYLHAGGAVGGVNIAVDLSEAGLDNYRLPEIHEMVVQDTIETSLLFLNLAPRELTIPLWAVCYLAPLMEPLRKAGHEPSFLLWLGGLTGAGKSSLAAILLCHFGRFTNKSLPASFKDTPNFLERRSFVLKDSLLVIDDYHPTNSGKDAAKMEATAQSMCRLFGDRTARGRLTSDIRIRKSKPARCLAIVTGEDVASLGESGAARILTLELGKSEIDFELLSKLQDKSESMGQAMAGYLQWLAERMNDLTTTLREEFLKRRELASSGGHRRMPETAAWLYLGLAMGLEYAQSMEAISQDEAHDLLESGWQTILQLCRKQGQQVIEQRPSTRFLNILNELIAAGEVEISMLTAFEEDGRVLFDNSNNTHKSFIGWKDEEWYYLLPDQTYRAIAMFCKQQGSRFPVTESTLWKNLDNEGLIEVEVSAKERRRKIQKTINGQKWRVVKLNAYHLRSESPYGVIAGNLGNTSLEVPVLFD